MEVTRQYDYGLMKHSGGLSLLDSLTPMVNGPTLAETADGMMGGC